MGRVPPASATPRLTIKSTPPAPAIHRPGGAITARGAAARHETPTAAAERATTTANAKTHPTVNRGNVSRNGRAVTTPAIAGKSNRLQRWGRPADHANTTATAAKPPTLILSRQRTPTIKPIKA